MGPRMTGAEGECVIWISVGHRHPLLISVGQLTDITQEPSPDGNSRCSVTDREIHVTEDSAISGGQQVEARFIPTVPEESRKAVILNQMRWGNTCAKCVIVHGHRPGVPTSSPMHTPDMCVCCVLFTVLSSRRSMACSRRETTQ